MKRKKLLCLIMVLLSMTAIPQQKTLANSTNLQRVQNLQTTDRTISGTVKTSKGEPVIGATIASEDGNEYAVTDIDGKFSILAHSDNEKFNVMCLGYESTFFSLTQTDNYNIILQEENIALEETVVVGYGVQKKASVTGSVASIGSEELGKTKNSNIQNMLTGRVPGLRVVQKTSEPGSFSMNFDIRGFGAPLIIIDGIPRNNMSRLDPNEIESISILKDASAAIYGVKAANGVVLITTKAGKGDGKINVSYNGNMTWQMTSGLPSTVGAVDYMEMINEMTNSNSDGAGAPTFSIEEIEAYRSGQKTSTDWYAAAIRELVPQTQNNVSISGGNEKIKFFTNIGQQYQEGFFKFGSLNYHRFNVRTKLNAQITKRLAFDLNINGIMDKKNSPSSDTDYIIYEWWKQRPTDPVYANNTKPYFYFVTADSGINPIALLDTKTSGYKTNQNKWFQSSASLTYKIPEIEGLEATALFSYDYTMGNDKSYKKAYDLYRYDEITQKYNGVSRNSPSSVRRGFSDGEKKMYQVSIKYDNIIKGDHHIGALALLEGSHQKGDNFYALRELSLEVDHLFAGNSENQIGYMNMSDLTETASMGIVGKFNYDYKGKYLVELMCRYDGSSIFEKSHRWGFFPSGSLGYRISEENFWKESPLNFINNFKIRGSYGIMGDDAALAYQFLSGYEYPYGFSFFDGKLVNGINNLGIPNPNITWFTAHTMNLGFDFEAWNGKLGIVFDWFQRSRYGLLATKQMTIPGVVGADLPQENLNSDRHSGYELELSHKNYINKNCYYTIKGNVSLTRTRHMHVESPKYRSNWQNWKENTNNRFKNIWWGIEAGGQYQNYDEIAEAPTYTDRTDLPGDYWYKDWNGDGFIDENDEHPIGYNFVPAGASNKSAMTPLLNYGFVLDFGFHGFDLNLLFQGASMTNIVYQERFYAPTNSSQHPPLEFWKDRWRPSEVGADPYKYDTEWISGKYPSMGGKRAIVNSEFNVHNNSYLRLKNIELGYSIPKKILDKVKINTLRVYLSGYNLLTFTNLKVTDPEHPNDKRGYAYPLNKTITLGLNIKF